MNQTYEKSFFLGHTKDNLLIHISISINKKNYAKIQSFSKLKK